MIILLSTFLATLICYADQPPCWCAFEEKSANGKYVAVVNRPKADSLIDPWKSVWTLTVYEYVGKRKKLLWKVKYDYSGYPDGILSNDGQTFIYVEYWYYSNANMVAIYRNGKRINAPNLKGEDFKIPPHKLQQTVSHQRWLKIEGPAYNFVRTSNDKLLLRIQTIDDKIHFFDITNGKRVTDT